MNYRNGDFPSDYEAKQAILEVGRRMYMKNFVAANDGNISCKVSEDTIWCTPTGVSKGYMTDDMLVLMDLDGNVLKGNLKPSSEVKMHLRVYKENPKMNAVVHAHPPSRHQPTPWPACPLDQRHPARGGPGAWATMPICPLRHARHRWRCPDSLAPLRHRPTTAACWPNHGALGRRRQPDVMEAWLRHGSRWSISALVSPAWPTACSGRPERADLRPGGPSDPAPHQQRHHDRRPSPVPQLQRRRRARLRELQLSLRGRSDGSAERLFRSHPAG